MAVADEDRRHHPTDLDSLEMLDPNPRHCLLVKLSFFLLLILLLMAVADEDCRHHPDRGGRGAGGQDGQVDDRGAHGQDDNYSPGEKSS
jgi:hypothetical protein